MAAMQTITYTCMQEFRTLCEDLHGGPVLQASAPIDGPALKRRRLDDRGAGAHASQPGSAPPAPCTPDPSPTPESAIYELAAERLAAAAAQLAPDTAASRGWGVPERLRALAALAAGVAAKAPAMLRVLCSAAAAWATWALAGPGPAALHGRGGCGMGETALVLGMPYRP